MGKFLNPEEKKGSKGQIPICYPFDICLVLQKIEEKRIELQK